MNVSYVVIIYFASLFVLSVADDEKIITKRFLTLKNVNFNKSEVKPKTPKKPQKSKTIFVLSNPVVYPQKLFSSEPAEKQKTTKKSTKNTTKNVTKNPTKNTTKFTEKNPVNYFDFLNFDAYILKPRNINYTALLSNTKNNVEEKEFKPVEVSTNYPPHEIIDFPRAEPLIQTTVSPTFETIPYETTPFATKAHQVHHETQFETFQETTTPKVNSLFPLGLAYFDSLRKYRKAFDSLQKREQTKKPRIKKGKTSTTTSTTTARTTTETEPPFIETTTDYAYVITPNFDEDLYKEPHFESYRYKPRFHQNIENDNERNHYDDNEKNHYSDNEKNHYEANQKNHYSDNQKNHYETTTRYLDYDTLDRDDNRYESTEAISTTTTRPPNSKRRKLKNPNPNLHSSHVKSNFLYDRYINYPQEEESRRVMYVARPDNYKAIRNTRNNTGTVPKTGTAGTDKPHKNIVPMQRHFFQ